MPKNDSLPTIWQIPDDLWNILQSELPPVKPPGTRGRPPPDQRTVFNGLVWINRTGCQWKQAPKEFGSGSALHQYHQQWVEHKVYERLFGRMLELYEEHVGIGFSWQSADGCMTKAPLGGEKTGGNPTDRGKTGTKRHVLVDERGAPLAVEIAGANVPDMWLLAETLAGVLIDRPEDGSEHLCLDKGYDTADCDACCEEFGYIHHTRRKGEAPVAAEQQKHPAKRWVVERTHSWYNRFRRLLVRWEKKAENYLGMIDMASIIILYRIIVRCTGLTQPLVHSV